MRNTCVRIRESNAVQHNGNELIQLFEGRQIRAVRSRRGFLLGCQRRCPTISESRITSRPFWSPIAIDDSLGIWSARGPNRGGVTNLTTAAKRRGKGHDTRLVNKRGLSQIRCLQRILGCRDWLVAGSRFGRRFGRWDCPNIVSNNGIGTISKGESSISSTSCRARLAHP